MHTEYIHFPERVDRSRFVARRFAPYFGESLLDVGCYEAPLRELLPQVRYTGVDFVGNPDIELNLETCARLPFDDRTFSCVICIEVLEHLNNLHAMSDELIRVSSRHVIVSLPNCWRDARRPIARGVGDFAHYGLPVDPPLDRHKWFINHTQVRDFFEGQAGKHGLKIVELFRTEQPKPAPARWLRKLIWPGDRYHNRFAQTTWVVYERSA